MEGLRQVLHIRLTCQIWILDWSSCDNSGDRLLGQNLRQRNKSGSWCKSTNTCKRSTCEEWGENNVRCFLGFWCRSWLYGVSNWSFPLLTLTSALLWRCKNFSFDIVLWRQYRIEVKISESGVKWIWIEVLDLLFYLLTVILLYDITSLVGYVTLSKILTTLRLSFWICKMVFLCKDNNTINELILESA